MRCIIADLNMYLSAHLDPELVLTSARALDQVPPGERGPLHGVAIGVKDIIYTKGT